MGEVEKKNSARKNVYKSWLQEFAANFILWSEYRRRWAYINLILFILLLFNICKSFITCLFCFWGINQMVLNSGIGRIYFMRVVAELQVDESGQQQKISSGIVPGRNWTRYHPRKIKSLEAKRLEISNFWSFTQDLRPLLLLLPSAIPSESRQLVNLPFVISLHGNCKLIRLFYNQ